MKKAIKALLATIALVVASLTAVAVTATPADAACGGYQWKYGNNTTWYTTSWNVQHFWQIRVLYRDCDGYDDIEQVDVVLTKQSGKCVQPGTLARTDYYANPNTIAGWNPGGTGQVYCQNGRTSYAHMWNTPQQNVHVTSGMAEANRCVGAQVGIIGVNGAPSVDRVVPSVCFNGL